MFEKIIGYRKYIKIAVILLAFLVILLFKNSIFKFDNTLTSVFNYTYGGNKLDTNIVIVHISAHDIESLGDWPLKRSYYALLINQLNRYGVKKIGLEIFLSQNLTSQKIYNNVIANVIKKWKNVVLSSDAGNVQVKNNIAIADTIFYPAPKLLSESIPSGHLNVLTYDGIYIPTQIQVKDRLEPCFIYALAGKKNQSYGLFKVNVYSSWKSFRNFSFLEFFNLAKNNNPVLNLLKNKIVIIGVSDPLLAKKFSTVYDDELPGVGLHALALDNLLTGRNINYSFKSLSTYVFIVFLLFLGFLKFSNKAYYFHTGIAFLIIAFGIFIFFHIEIDYLSFFIPLILLGIVDTAIDFSEKKLLLKKSESETENLRKSLRSKEEELLKLEEELKHTAFSQSEALKQQIEELNAEIEKLKKAEQDEEIAKVVEDENIVKNFEGIIYRSKKIASVVDLIKKVAPENATVLVLGESGSGKELVAQAIHKLSTRKDKNFVVVNCAALSDTLLESELFGHVKGAFTDAVKDKKGRFEAADGGTIFLDEIGETSENFQVKLLRVLQTGDFQRVGSSETIHADVRVVAATNKNLEKLVKEGKFREDLYYRLNVISIKIPPLRERKEDIEILANYFIKKEFEQLSISKAVMNQLVQNQWKGNVRELESVMKRAAIFAKSENREIIKLRDLPEELAKQDKSNLENLIIESLREKKFSHSSINETARELGDLNRTVVSENFRGIFFKYYCEYNYNLEKAVNKIAATDEEEVKEKVRSKVTTYLNNIEKDIEKSNHSDFENIKSEFASKYKNLPQKYHSYLDKVIRKIIEN